jgi:hypothetical protein
MQRKIRTGIWIIVVQSGLCLAADKSSAPEAKKPPPAPLATPVAPVAPTKPAPNAATAKKVEPPSLSPWEIQLAERGKIGLQTGYVSAKRGSEEWRASNSARVEFAYLLSPLPAASMTLWALMQYGAFAVAPEMERGDVVDSFVGRVEDFGVGVEINRRFSRWLLLGQGVLGFQRIVLADQAQVEDSEPPRGRSVYLQAKVAAGWIFLEKWEVGPFLAAEKGIVTALETGLFLRASF